VLVDENAASRTSTDDPSLPCNYDKRKEGPQRVTGVPGFMQWANPMLQFGGAIYQAETRDRP